MDAVIKVKYDDLPNLFETHSLEELGRMLVDNEYFFIDVDDIDAHYIDFEKVGYDFSTEHCVGTSYGYLENF